MTKVPDNFDRAAPDSAAPMITLTKASSEFGEIRIVESRIKGSHIYWQGGWQQSEADRNGVGLATYVHAIFGLLTQTTAREMRMIGCGGWNHADPRRQVRNHRRHQPTVDHTCPAVLLFAPPNHLSRRGWCSIPGADQVRLRRHHHRSVHRRACATPSLLQRVLSFGA